MPSKLLSPQLFLFCASSNFLSLTWFLTTFERTFFRGVHVNFVLKFIAARERNTTGGDILSLSACLFTGRGTPVSGPRSLPRGIPKSLDPGTFGGGVSYLGLEYPPPRIGHGMDSRGGSRTSPRKER